MGQMGDLEGKVFLNGIILLPLLHALLYTPWTSAA